MKFITQFRPAICFLLFIALVAWLGSTTKEPEKTDESTKDEMIAEKGHNNEVPKEDEEPVTYISLMMTAEGERRSFFEGILKDDLSYYFFSFHGAPAVFKLQIRLETFEPPTFATTMQETLLSGDVIWEAKTSEEDANRHGIVFRWGTSTSSKKLDRSNGMLAVIFPEPTQRNTTATTTGESQLEFHYDVVLGKSTLGGTPKAPLYKILADHEFTPKGGWLAWDSEEIAGRSLSQLPDVKPLQADESIVLMGRYKRGSIGGKDGLAIVVLTATGLPSVSPESKAEQSTD